MSEPLGKTLGLSRSKPSTEAIYEGAVGQVAGPDSAYLLKCQTIFSRSCTSEPLGKTSDLSQPDLALKRPNRAIGQQAGPVSNRTTCQSVASELSGSTPGPPRIEPSAKAQ